jgi:phytanoyl-CoA hydroxylase
MTSDNAEYTFDDGIADPHTDALYRSSVVAEGIDGFEALDDAEAERFHAQGYLVIHNAFSAGEVQEALDGLLDLIDGRYPGYRGIQFEGQGRALLPTLPRERKQDVVRKLSRFVPHDERLKALAQHPRLLAAVSRLMGEAPELFQDQALIKPPLIGREKPWHQDNAYFNLPPDTTIVGVWIALDRAMPENGCMYLIPGSHREGPVVHFKRRDWQICDSDVAAARSVMAPLDPGGCLLFHGLLHHGTPASHSPLRRRAVQFHYKPASSTPISADERLGIFGSEGKDVTC